MKMNYSVLAVESGDFGCIETILAHDIGINEAKSIAMAESGKGKDIYIKWFRNSDQQHGYINPDGNSSLTGKPW
jgi:hypothetical protein